MSTGNLSGTLSSIGNLTGSFGTSGGSGTTNYNELSNKPQINGNTLEGNKTPAELGINLPNMNNYYDKTATDTLLSIKADKSELPNMNNYYDKTATDSLLANKADKSELPNMNNYYNKIATDSLLANKADKSELPDMNDYYNKTATDSLLANKADKSELPDMNNYYDKTTTNSLLSNKADKSELPDMNNYYDKTATDTLLSNKANISDVYSKTDIDNLFSRIDIKSQVTFIESITGTNTQVYVKAGVVYIFYQGENKSHNANDQLFTMPTTYKPSNMTYVLFNVNDTAYGQVGIDSTNGNCFINRISTAGASGRIYFTISYPLA